MRSTSRAFTEQIATHAREITDLHARFLSMRDGLRSALEMLEQRHMWTPADDARLKELRGLLKSSLSASPVLTGAHETTKTVG